MKKALFYSLLAVPVFFGISIVSQHSSVPSYVKNAEERVHSYISYSYGPTSCNSAQGDKKKWTLECQASDGVKNFKYVIYSSDDFAHDFYVVAVSEDAKLNTQIDLMAYLDIRVNAV